MQIVTENSGHARSLMAELDLDAHDSVVIVSGDGLMSEVGALFIEIQSISTVKNCHCSPLQFE